MAAKNQPPQVIGSEVVTVLVTCWPPDPATRGGCYGAAPWRGGKAADCLLPATAAPPAPPISPRLPAAPFMKTEK